MSHRSPNKTRPGSHAPRLVVGYWRTRCLAQPIRVMLAHMGVPFEDRQYQVGDGPGYDKKVWNEAKVKLEKSGLEYPNLPYIIDTDGTALSQTRTIMRYLATTRPEHGLIGSDLKQQTRVDLTSEVCQEMLDLFVKVTYSAWIEFSAAKSNFLAEVLPGYLNRFERAIKCNLPGGWCTGSSLTYADFLLHEALFQISQFHPPSFKEYPNIKGFMKRFEALPNVAAYKASNQYLHTPFHNRYSQFVHWADGAALPESAESWGPSARLHGPPEGRPTMTGPQSFLHTVFYPDGRDDA